MIFATDGSHKSVGRVGDVTQERATNEAVNTNEASKIANLLQGLAFPATKEQIKNYISTYEIERALGLIVKRNNDKDMNKDEKRRKEATNREDKKVEVTPYTRDKALNKANKKRFGEKARPDPYDIGEGHEEKNPK